MRERSNTHGDPHARASDALAELGPGKETLVEREYRNLQRRHQPFADTFAEMYELVRPVQRQATEAPKRGDADTHAIAADGVSGAGGQLPHAERIIASVGEQHRATIEGISAHIGGPAGDASRAIHADAYATGNQIAFAATPDVGLAAHEATHVIQQQAGVQLKGGVGQAGDAYEQQADAVAGAVERGESAVHLLEHGPAAAGRSTGSGVQRQVAVRPVPAQAQPDAAVLSMTATAFIEYTRQQADWSTHFTGPQKGPLQHLLHDLLAEPALPAGLGGFSMTTLLAAPPADWVTLRRYCAAVHAAATVPTAKMSAATTLARALEIGAALPRLEGAVGGGTVLFHITSPTSVDQLIGDGRVDELILYCLAKQPQWLAPDGKEFDSFRRMSRFFFLRYAALGDVRNLHHFDDAALARLQADAGGGHAGRPLAVILHNGVDHNGAFHHDGHLTAAITGNPHRVVMIEGRDSLGAVETEVRQVAAAYGGGQINQVMIAGHGESRVIEQAGTTSPAADAQGRPTVEGHGDDIDLDSNHAATMQLFNTLLPLMGGADSRIVFNACLTASSDIKLDPGSPVLPQTQIANQLAARPSLVDTVRGMVAARGGTTTVLGGNGSFPEGPDFIDASGNFDINWTGDPALTSVDRLDYVRRGIEPTGVLRAVLEHWQPPPAAPAPPPAWLVAVNDRLTRPTNGWDGAIITHALRQIQGAPANAQQISDLAHAVAAISECLFPDEARVDRLVNGVAAALRPLLFSAVEGSTDWPGYEDAAAIPIYEVWARITAAKYPALITHLTTSGFTTSRAEPYLDWGFLNDTDLGHLLPGAARAAPTRGHLVIACSSIRNGPPSRVSREFLIAIARANGNHFPAALAITSVADDSSEEEILQAIGLAGSGASSRAGGPTVVDANVDANNDGTNESYVDRTAGYGAVINCSVLRVHAGPDNAAAEIGFLNAGDQVFVQGTRNGWCSIDFSGRTGYVWRRFLRVT
jgi:hypothetical protein